MKWGYASTAAIVRSLQKDLFYRKQLQSDLKLILLDHLPTGWIFRIEDDWLPLLVDCFYYTVLTGRGDVTLGESYSHLLPVDTNSRSLFLKNKVKRTFWILSTIILPFVLKKGLLSQYSNKMDPQRIKRLFEIIEPLNTILFYFSGKFPSFINQFLSIRYIFYPRKPPLMDQDALIYKGLATVLSLITLKKLKDFYDQIDQNTEHQDVKSSLMRKSRELIKCPVCFDTLEGVSFASIKCGHVYCWYCISRWMESEKNCPVCRKPCDPPDLIPLANI